MRGAVVVTFLLSACGQEAAYEPAPPPPTPEALRLIMPVVLEDAQATGDPAAEQRVLDCVSRDLPRQWREQYPESPLSYEQTIAAVSRGTETREERTAMDGLAVLVVYGADRCWTSESSSPTQGGR